MAELEAAIARLRRVPARAADRTAGRSLDGFGTAHLTFVTVDRDRDRARRRWIERLSRRYAQDFGPLVDRYGVAGTPEQCAEQIERFHAAGCGYFLLNPICEPAEEQEQVEMLAAEVVPLLSGR